MKKKMEEFNIIRKKEKNKIKKPYKPYISNYKIVVNFITGDLSEDYKKLNGDWNYSKLSKDINLSILTIRKYILIFESHIKKIKNRLKKGNLKNIKTEIIKILEKEKEKDFPNKKLINDYEINISLINFVEGLERKNI